MVVPAAGFDKVSISADGNRIAIGSDYVHVYQYNSGSISWTNLVIIFRAKVNPLSPSSDGKRVVFGLANDNNLVVIVLVLRVQLWQ